MEVVCINVAPILWGLSYGMDFDCMLSNLKSYTLHEQGICGFISLKFKKCQIFQIQNIDVVNTTIFFVLLEDQGVT